MKQLKNKLRLFCTIILILLAVAGIGLVGIALPPTGKKENTIEIKTELLESEEQDSETATSFNYKQ